MLELYSSRISVDQDLSVIVAKIDNDDDVKQRLVLIVFHASVTHQRSSGSKTRISCSHVHERTNSLPTLANKGFEKKGTTQTDAENMKNSGDKTDRATMHSTTHTSKYVCVLTKKVKKTQLLNSSTKEPRIPENMVGTKNTNNFQKHASRPLSAEHGPWIVHTIRDKNFEILGQVRMLKRKSCCTQKGEKQYPC